MEVESLFACWALTGSRLAKRSLLLLVNTALCQFDVLPDGIWTKGALHSSRTLWTVRAILRAYQVSGDAWYLQAAREICANAMSGDYVTKLSRAKKGTTKATFPLRWVLSRENSRTFWGWEADPEDPYHNKWPVEACWQAAVAGSAFWLGCRLDPDSNWKAAWRLWGLYAADCISYCWDGEGYRENYSFAREEDGKPTYFCGYEGYLLGTAAWCFDTVARAYVEETGTNKEIYAHVLKAWEKAADLRAGGEDPFRPGGVSYHKWHGFLAREIDAHCETVAKAG